MKNRFFENNFFAAAVVIFLIIFLHFITILQPFEYLITVIFSPFQVFIYSTTAQASSGVSKIGSYHDLTNENKELKDKISELEQKIVELKFYIEENQLLFEQDKYLKTQGFNFINARVIGRGAENNPNLFIINRGKNDGLKTGMAVVVENGVLVGKIETVQNRTAHVLLLVDNNSRLSAAVSGQSDIVGLIEGKNNISLSLNEILKSAHLAKGDFIMTSGFDKNIPAGLLIGEVDKIIDEQGELFKSAKIISPVSYKNLRIVSVVLE